MITIVHTGPLLALLNRRDQHHEWTIRALERVHLPFWTCEEVLLEADWLTKQGRALREMVSQGKLRIGLRIGKQAHAVSALMKRFADRMDLADACVVRLTGLQPQSQVFMTDFRDFSVYRRNRRSVIPLLAPALDGELRRRRQSWVRGLDTVEIPFG